MGSTVIGGNKEAAIIAINKTGALETSFGTNGIATYDVDLGAGNAEFTGIDYHDEELYLSGTLFDGQNKPFASRVFEADGAIDSVNFGDANGYRKISYATDNAFALGMSLDGDETMWLPGYVESGADTNMIISAVDKDGILCNKDCKFDFSDGMQTFTHSSVASNDNASEIIQINAGVHASKFLLAAVANDGTNDQVVLTRLTAAGALDTSFSDDGHKQIQIGTSALVNGLFELPSGKFIVYGNVTEGADVDGFIARLDNNGNLDSTFANNGIYTTTAISASTIEFSQAAIDSNGNIVAVGQIDNSSNSSFIIRLDGSGQLDTSFNSIGYRIGSNTDEYLSLLIDSNNDIYAAGSRLDTDKEMLIVKYANTGALDTSFSGDGILTIDVNASSDDYATRVLFDSSNDLYIIGNNFAAQQQVSVVKISPSGGLDTSFDGDGVASFIMAPLLANAGVTDAVIDNNDNVVVVGFGQLLGTNAGMIGRIKPNGSLDTSFTLFGFYSVTSCANTAQLESVILLNNSSLVVAGQCYINASSKNNIELSQYQLD